MRVGTEGRRPPESCGGIPRRSRRGGGQTRWGLTALLAFSGLWATFQAGRLVAPAPENKIVFYILGLIVGLATVGAWLYFCSAYAGRSYHRRRLFRIAGLAVFGAIVSIKITSPIHGLYFTTAYATSPFPHLRIQFGAMHWVVTVLAYALAAVGFYLLFDLFRNSEYATSRLAFLVGIAGLPVVLDLIGFLGRDVILTLNYEPVGVGLFALGVLYVADGTFIRVRAFGREQLIDELDQAVLLLDRDDIIRDVNAPATRLFPELAGSTGKGLPTVSPQVADYLPVETPKRITTTVAGGTRHYLLSAPQLTAGQTVLGQALVFTDISKFIQQRDEIERHESQLDDLAEAITHELRNTLNVMQGHIDLAQSGLSTSETGSAVESLETAGRMTERMGTLVSDLAMLAQLGRSVDPQDSADIERIATHAFASVAGDTCELCIDADTIEADTNRLQRLFEKLFDFAIANGATRIEVSQRDSVLSITDDGTPISSEQVEAAFTYGQAVPDAKTGMLLPVARTLVDAQGWDITVDPEYQRGVRIVITT
ncbi:histidine kinase N-terminal 7TM domain-containing protein [Halobaculum rubrum]|uniref:sensor histidine kinase n=1 Tax=Halobaculum rubrum TaxID=2872158 RepID=UPI001CA40F4E|nr:histidine kinase N-terminal 7TM domain-containing protein [Halobaculum rubrum]QZX98774.1 hypothetical protein K6T25_10865 [Halobaculum rubrum]